MYPFDDQWCLVTNPHGFEEFEGHDYIYVGDRDHRPGVSWKEKFGNEPAWENNIEGDPLHRSYVLLYKVI